MSATAALLNASSQGATAEAARGFSNDYKPTLLERISGWGVNLGSEKSDGTYDGYSSAFFIAQPRKLLGGYLLTICIILMLSVIAIVSAATGHTEVIMSVSYIVISLVLPIVIFGVACLLQNRENNIDTFEFYKRVENIKEAASAQDVNAV
jgi:hypothetical protein